MISRQAVMAALRTVMPALVPAVALAAGTDEQAAGLVQELAPDYLPWFSALFVAPAGVESWLFALQGALGLAGLSASLVLLRRRSKAGRKDPGHAD